MNAWDELIATALVGTERRPMSSTLVADVAGALGAELPPAPAELSVLTAAGVLAAYRRAGWIPPVHPEDAPQPSPPDHRPVASVTAGQLLELLLEGQVALPGGPTSLVIEWLERCSTSGHRLPERLLPRLLASATADRALRAGALAAGGPRLRWLAGLNPDWSWATTDDAALFDLGESDAEGAVTIWETGDREVRMNLLVHLRATRPSDGRALVETTWSRENARDRTAIVKALSSGLGPDDEPFLEAALDDRAKGVREVAAELLATLPSSRLAARMFERLRPLVKFGGRLRKKLDVALPEEPDLAARRDGIVDEGAPARTGPRAWWLAQIVAATPLTFWKDILGIAPETVVRLAEGREVRHGLALAALRQREPAWAAALLSHHPLPSLLTVLLPAEAATAVTPLLATATDAQVAVLLDATPGPWSAPISRAALGRLRAAKTTGPLQQAMDTLVERLDPTVAAEVEAWVADLRDDNYARRFVRGLSHALSIRQTIARELS